MNAALLRAQCIGLSARKLDYWVHSGVLGDDKANASPYARRDYSEEELRIIQVVARASHAFGVWSAGRAGFVSIYREIAAQMRAGADIVHIVLAPGIVLNIDVEIEASAPEPLVACSNG